MPAAVVVGIAFALPGVTNDDQSLHIRWHDGIVFGVAARRRRGRRAACSTRLPRPGRARARAAPRRRSSSRRDRRRGVRSSPSSCSGIELGRGRQRRGPDRLDELELPLHLVEQAWQRLPPTARRDRRRLVPAAQPAATGRVVPRLRRPSRTTCRCSSSARPGSSALVLLLAALRRAAARARCAAAGRELALALLLPRTSSTRSSTSTGTSWPSRRRRSSPPERSSGAPARAARRAASPSCRARGARSSCFGSLLLAVARPPLGRARRWRREPRTRDRRSRTARTRVDPLLVEPYWTKAHARRRSSGRRARVRLLRRGRPAAAGEPADLAVARASTRCTVDCPFRRTTTSSTTPSSTRRRPGQGGDDYNAMLKLVDQRAVHVLTLAAPSTTRAARRAARLGDSPSSGPTTFTCRSCASRSPSAAQPGRYMTTVVA